MENKETVYMVIGYHYKDGTILPSKMLFRDLNDANDWCSVLKRRVVTDDYAVCEVEIH